MKKKVEKWVKDLQELSEIALDESQAALSGFTKALCHQLPSRVFKKEDLLIKQPAQTSVRPLASRREKGPSN